MHIAGMDLNLAMVLHALLDERSVSRAARRLGLSAAEVRVHLRTAVAFGCVNAVDIQPVLELIDRVLAMGWRLSHPRDAGRSSVPAPAR